MLGADSMTTQLPPLNAVRVFETAARHLNFSRAAEELGVTSSAVSKQIAILEDFIGGQLFDRQKSGLALTLEGRELKNSLQPAFEMLSASFQRYSRRPPNSEKFRLATVASFASEFLVPRLRDFGEQFPDVELEILTSDRLLDLTREEVDLSVRYGAGEWQGLVSQELSPGRLLPVCKPRYELTPARGPEGSPELRRLQVFSTNEWKNWAQAEPTNIRLREPPIVMEHFLVALRAVRSGVGVALLPDVIVFDGIANRDIEQVGEGLDWPHTFHLVHLPKARRLARTKRVMEWMISEFARSNR